MLCHAMLCSCRGSAANTSGGNRSAESAGATAAAVALARVEAGVATAAAVANRELGGAVSGYGRQPEGKDVPRIKAPSMRHYGELDTRINEGWPAYEQALKAAGTTYEAYIYKGANHGFHNDSTPRYDEAAANLAWERTLGWFNKYLA